MVREKGTLNNFMADGAISRESVLWLLRSGKVPIGQERTRLIEREQLKKWGVLIEGPVPAQTTRPAAKPKIKKAGTDKEEVMQIV
jgi:hypothetical protein